MAGALGSLPSSQSVLGNIGSDQGRSRRPQQPGTQSTAPRATQPAQAPQTFAQMQQQGIARPAPPQAQAPPAPYQQPAQASQPIQSQLQGAVSKALTTPSPYSSQTFNTLRDSATNDLSAQYAKIRDTTNTNLASRGLAASTYGANDLHDVDTAQSRDLADLNSNLLGQAATTQGQYEQGAITGGQNLVNSQNSNALGVAGLTGNYNGQTTLGGLQQQLASQVGLGGLGVQQGQLALANTANSQQYGLSQQQLALQQMLGQGNLGVAQQQANTQQAGTLGNLQLGQQQLAQSGGQFQQTFGLQQQAQNASQQQFQQQLMQALGIATMGDRTANRGIDAQSQLSQSQLLLQMALSGAGGYGGSIPGLATGAGGGSGYGSNPYGGSSGGGGTDTTTVNYGGQQYTPQQFQQLQITNPSMFQPTDPNANFYANNQQQFGANSAATASTYQNAEQQAMSGNALQQAIQQFYLNNPSHQTLPGSAQYGQPNPAFTLPNGQVLSQQQRDAASLQWSQTHDPATGALIPSSHWGTA